MQFTTYKQAQAHRAANNMTGTHTVERINLAGHSGQYFYTLLPVAHGAPMNVGWTGDTERLFG